MTNPTSAALHAWGNEWISRHIAFCRQLIASYTPDQRQIVWHTLTVRYVLLNRAYAGVQAWAAHVKVRTT